MASGLHYETGRDMPPGMQQLAADKIVQQVKQRISAMDIQAKRSEPVRFRIVSAPVSVDFECPYCETDVSIPWKDTGHPDYWLDPWPDINCPYCHKEVSMGDWEYD